MRLVDLHSDTIYLMKMKENRNLRKNNFHIDIDKLKKSCSLVQCFAIFNVVTRVDDLYIATMDTYDFYKNIMDNNEELKFALSYEDILKNDKNDKISVLMTIEDAGGVDYKIERISEFYDKGVRMMSLIWNHENCFGYPNSSDSEIMNKGLKDFGHKAIKIMNDLGIIIDVSHLSDQGTIDILEISTKPIVASHSNSRVITNNQRNLSDTIIKLVSKNNGLIGITLYDVLVDNGKVSTVDNIIKHIEHIREIAGIDSIAIGTDFDGFINDGTMEINNIGEMHKLWDGLRKAGFSELEIEKIAWKNAMRVFEEILK